MADEIRIVRGVPTDEELAAIVGVLLTRGTVAESADPVVVSRWSQSSRPRHPWGPRGADAWRTSARPR